MRICCVFWFIFFSASLVFSNNLSKFSKPIDSAAWDLPALPEKINSFSSLVTYVDHYFKDNHRTFSSGLAPNSKVVHALDYFQIRLTEGSMSNERVNEIMENTFNIDLSPVVMLFLDRNKLSILLFESRPSYDETRIVEKYRHFLLKNSSFSYLSGLSMEPLLTPLKEIKDEIAEISKTFNDKPRWAMKRIGVTALAKNHIYALNELINNAANDNTRLIKLLEFLYEKPDTAQVLDAYLIAEYSIELIDGIVEKLTEVSNAEPDQPSFIPGFAKLLQHRDFPLRKCLLTYAAVATHFLEFANQFRSNAGLSPISRDEINKERFADSHMRINLQFPTFFTSQVSLKSKVTKKSTTLAMPTPQVDQRKNEPQVVSSKEEITESSPLDTHRTDTTPLEVISQEGSNEEEVGHVEFEYKKRDRHLKARTETETIPLGEAVYRLINNKGQQILNTFFKLQDNKIKQSELSMLNNQVYKALVELNYLEVAKQFLHDVANPHFFHPKEGKGASLPAIYLEYRIIPYLLHGIIPPGFVWEHIIQSSKILRTHYAFNKKS